MVKKFLKDIFIILIILFLLLVLLEIFSLYKIKQKENNATLKEEYLPLLKYSDISKDELEDHISNIKKLGIDNNNIREYHPNTIYLYKPNLKSETFYTNSLGLLDDEPNYSKNQIMLLGSSVAGGGLRQNFKENIDGFLENIISKKISKKKYEVLNAGIGGFASNQEFFLMHSLLDKIKFDQVIYFSGANDIDSRYRVRNFDDLRSYDIIHSRVIKSRIEDNLLLTKNPFISMYTYARNYFLRSLYSYKYFGDLIHEKKVNKLQKIKKVDLTKEDHKTIDEIVENYISNVEKMIIITKEQNTDLYVGLQPILPHKKIKTINEKKNLNIILNKFGYKYQLYFDKAYPKMKKKLLELEKKYPGDIVVLNTENIFDEINIDIFRDNSHFLDYANKIVSNEIFLNLKFNEQ
tara:strand:+ start:583 stop:1803 length:1221 start_codon:yes stop_codon:yes gene_type:complete